MAPVAQRWLWQAHACPAPAKALPVASGPCRLCGDPAGRFSARHGIPDTFNDLDVLACPDSPALCAACAWYLAAQGVRQRHWIVTPTTATEWARPDLRPVLAARLAAVGATDACYGVTTSWKKHSHLLRCPVTAAGSRVVLVQVEDGTAALDAVRFAALLAAIDGLLALGHRKSEIEAGKLSQLSLIRHTRWGEASAHMALLRPWLGGPELALALYATLVSKEGEEHGPGSPSGGDSSGVADGGAAGADPVAARRARVQTALPQDDLGAVRVESAGGGAHQPHLAGLVGDGEATPGGGQPDGRGGRRGGRRAGRGAG